MTDAAIALDCEEERAMHHRPTVPVLTPNVLWSTSNFCDRSNITFAIGVPWGVRMWRFPRTLPAPPPIMAIGIGPPVCPLPSLIPGP